MCSSDLETVFAHLLDRQLDEGMKPKPDDVLVVHALFSVRNTGYARRSGHLWLPCGDTSQVNLGYKCAQKDDLAPAIARTRLLRPLWIGVAGDKLPTQVRLDNEAAADRTLIEIETEDRVGLLYRISQTLAELRLDLILAKIVTEKGAAADSFYVTEIGGGKVMDEGRQRHIVERLQDAILHFDAPG